MAVQLPVRRVIAENSSIIPREQVEVDEGKVVTNSITLRIFPHLFADEPVSSGTADYYGFVGDLGQPFEALLSCSHAPSIAQLGYFLSYLEGDRHRIEELVKRKSGAHSSECAPPCFETVDAEKLPTLSNVSRSASR